MVVEIRRKSDRVMAMVLVLEELGVMRAVMRVICANGPQARGPDSEKDQFYNKIL